MRTARTASTSLTAPSRSNHPLRAGGGFVGEALATAVFSSATAVVVGCSGWYLSMPTSKALRVSGCKSVGKNVGKLHSRKRVSPKRLYGMFPQPLYLFCGRHLSAIFAQTHTGKDARHYGGLLRADFFPRRTIVASILAQIDCFTALIVLAPVPSPVVAG